MAYLYFTSFFLYSRARARVFFSSNSGATCLFDRWCCRKVAICRPETGDILPPSRANRAF